MRDQGIALLAGAGPSTLQKELILYATSCDDLIYPVKDKVDDHTEDCTYSCSSDYYDLEDDFCKRVHDEDTSSSGDDDTVFDDDEDSFCYDEVVNTDVDGQQNSDSSFNTSISYFHLPTEGLFTSTINFPTRKVSFGDVYVREHAVTVGDHPAISDSCPLTLDWEHTATVRHNILEFEYTRVVSRKTFKRLSLGERRQRVQRVKGIEDVEVRKLEANLTNCRLDEIKQQLNDITQLEQEVDTVLRLHNRYKSDFNIDVSTLETIDLGCESLPVSVV